MRVQTGAMAAEPAVNELVGLYQETVKPLCLRLGLIPAEAPAVGTVPEGRGALRSR